MFKVLPNSTSAIVVVFIALLACLFLCQTFMKIIFYLFARFQKTSYTGYEMLDYLKTKNNLDDVKITKKKFNFTSSFYSYKKRKKEFVVNNSSFKKENLYSNLKAIESITYANEQIGRTLQYRWKFVGMGLVSIIAYLILIGIMLLTYLPHPDVNGVVSIGYWMAVEVLCVIGWIVVLITLFWWMSATQNFEIDVEQQSKKIINDKDLTYRVSSFMKFASYVPFSFRTIV